MPDSWLHVVLYQPEIPPNTGNIIRLCANTGVGLHLVEPLGFAWDDRRLRRAGLDYHEYVRVLRHSSWRACRETLADRRFFAFSTKGQPGVYAKTPFAEDDVFVFGPETRGLPSEILAEFPQGHLLRLPMLPEQRSLNLANSCAVAVYEAWRQLGFLGGV